MSGSVARIGDYPLMSCEVTFALSGAWELVGRVSAEKASDVEGSVTVTIGDQDLAGTATAGEDGAAGIYVRVVGGAGGLGASVTPQGYTASATFKTVLDDIANAGGETISSETDSGVLSTAGRWTRTAGTVADALDAVAEAAGATWRIRTDGDIWVGTDTWDKVEPEHTVIDEAPNRGRMIVGLEGLDVLPGQTFLDHKIVEAVYRIDERKLRAELRYGDTPVGIGDLIGEMVRRVNGPVDWSACYLYEVQSQKSDGTLTLESADARMPDLDDVVLRAGVGGVSENKVLPRTQVIVTHENADRRRPVVIALAQTQAQTLVLDLLEKIELKAGQTLKVSPSSVECGGSQPLALWIPLMTWATGVQAALASVGASCPALAAGNTQITKGA